MISLRSVKLIMHSVVPGPISEDAVRLLKVFLERKAEELTLHASRIHNWENEMRDELGERHKVILSPKHLKMAIEGKYSKSPENGHANSED
jgi:Iap family predicted aminopeptidase